MWRWRHKIVLMSFAGTSRTTTFRCHTQPQYALLWHVATCCLETSKIRRRADSCIRLQFALGWVLFAEPCKRVVSGDRRTGGRVPQISSRGGQSCKSPPTSWHNNAIAGFTSQSIGLPAYACKTDSSTAIQLAPRMTKNLPFWAQKSTKNSEEGHSHLPRPLPRLGGGHPSSYLTPHPLGASFLALAMIRPPLFKQWIRPYLKVVTHHIQVSAVSDEPARRAASRSSWCKQRCTLSMINWRQSSVELSCQVLRRSTSRGEKKTENSAKF